MIKFIFQKIIAPLFFFVLTICAVYGSFLIWKVIITEKKVSLISENPVSFIGTIKNLIPEKEINLSGFDEGRINILLLGISGEKKGGTNLSDTLMVASVNTKTNQVALLSLPRDLYLEIPDSDRKKAKINTLYQYGLIQHPGNPNLAVKTIKDAVEDILALPIHYWAILDFEGFIEIIDAVGGININNERDIYDPRYPGPGYSYITFELPAGFHHLDGETALKYARMRHDIEGDFGRAKRQQQVIQAAKNKIFSVGTMLNVLSINSILNALGDNLRTNIRTDEIEDFLELLKIIDTNNINNIVFDAWDKKSLLIVSHVFYGDTRAFVLVPRAGNWEELRQTSQNIFDLNAVKKRREEITAENAKVALINESGNDIVAGRVKDLLQENFEYKNTVALSAPDEPEKNTIVYDLSDGKMPYTLDELAKKLPAGISEIFPEKYEKSLGNIAPDIVIVAGQDLIRNFGMEKGSFEEYNSSND